MARVQLENVSKEYDGAPVLEPTSLSIRDGEFMTLLGPSGCGKTTTLRMIAGFIEPEQGTVQIDGTDVTHLPPQKRRIGMVFQDYALFPHMTVAENIGFGLTTRRFKRHEVEHRVKELLELIRLPDVGHRYPAEVSGGQQQRIAVARAVAFPPGVLLMDEPLGALDLKMREVMQVELRQIQQTLGITTVYVTHDQTEAMTMSDRIVVMNKGRIEQIGTAQEIYRRPATRFVADFVGKINFMRGTVVSVDAGTAIVRVATTQLRVTDTPTLQAGTSVSLAVRPEHLHIRASSAAFPGYNKLEGTVSNRVFSGNFWHITVMLPGEVEWLVESREPANEFEVGAEVQVLWLPECGIILLQ